MSIKHVSDLYKQRKRRMRKLSDNHKKVQNRSDIDDAPIDKNTINKKKPIIVVLYER